MKTKKERFRLGYLGIPFRHTLIQKIVSNLTGTTPCHEILENLATKESRLDSCALAAFRKGVKLHRSGATVHMFMFT